MVQRNKGEAGPEREVNRKGGGSGVNPSIEPPNAVDTTHG